MPLVSCEDLVLVFAVAERLGVDPAQDLRPGVFVASAWGACRIAQQRWVDSSGQEDLRRLTSAAFRTLAAGLAAPAGLVAPAGTTTADIGPKPNSTDMTETTEVDRRTR